MKKVIAQLTILMTALLQPVSALADECKQVSFGAVSWTDVQATTATAETLLTYLGYEVSTEELSVPEVYQKLEKGELDIFLGNWMPTMKPILQPYLESESVEVLAKT